MLFSPPSIGILDILFTFENEPHTYSYHIANLPNGILSHIILHLVLLTVPPQFYYPSISSAISFPIYRLSSIHLPNTETHPWAPHPTLVLFHKLVP